MRSATNPPRCFIGATAFASLLVITGNQASHAQERNRPALPEPDVANSRYGEHERNVLDLWQAKSESPTPLMVYIHGGGFRAGDKRTLIPQVLQMFLDAGISVAAVNYRLTDTAPFPAAHLDCARAIQTLRHRAAEWNLDTTRIGTTGGSAGGGISLWLAFHDDLAKPDSDDPIERESTRLACVALAGAQCSYDPRFTASIGLPRLEKHPFFYDFYGITPAEFDSEKAHKLYEQAAAINYLTPDDHVAVLLTYGVGDVPIDDATPMNTIVHHPKFGIVLKERMDKLNLECVVIYADQPGGSPRENALTFFRRHLLANE